MMEMMKEIRVQLDIVEEDRRRQKKRLKPQAESDNELDEKPVEDNLEEEEEASDQFKMMKDISKINKIPRIEIQNDMGNLNPEESIDWMNGRKE